MIVTKDASTDGSVFVAHSDDDDLSDQSIVYVPAKNYPRGAKERFMEALSLRVVCRVTEIFQYRGLLTSAFSGVCSL
jgi:hypothetical protein